MIAHHLRPDKASPLLTHNHKKTHNADRHYQTSALIHHLIEYRCGQTTTSKIRANGSP